MSFQRNKPNTDSDSNETSRTPDAPPGPSDLSSAPAAPVSPPAAPVKKEVKTFSGVTLKKGLQEQKEPLDKKTEKSIGEVFGSLYARSLNQILWNPQSLADYISATKSYIQFDIDNAFENKFTHEISSKVKFSHAQRLDIDIDADSSSEEEKRKIKESRIDLTDPSVANKESKLKEKGALPTQTKFLRKIVQHLFVNSKVGLQYIKDKITPLLPNDPEREQKAIDFAKQIQASLSAKGTLLDNMKKWESKPGSKEFLEQQWENNLDSAIKYPKTPGIVSYDKAIAKDSSSITFTNDPLLAAQEIAEEVKQNEENVSDENSKDTVLDSSTKPNLFNKKDIKKDSGETPSNDSNPKNQP